MPRFYCDYCDAYLTHDSMSGRQQHMRGWKHRENFKLYYMQHLPGWQMQMQQQQMQMQGFPPVFNNGYPAMGQQMQMAPPQGHVVVHPQVFMPPPTASAPPGAGVTVVHPQQLMPPGAGAPPVFRAPPTMGPPPATA